MPPPLPPYLIDLPSDIAFIAQHISIICIISKYNKCPKPLCRLIILTFDGQRFNLHSTDLLFSTVLQYYFRFWVVLSAQFSHGHTPKYRIWFFATMRLESNSLWRTFKHLYLIHGDFLKLRDGFFFLIWSINTEPLVFGATLSRGLDFQQCQKVVMNFGCIWVT